MIALADTRTSTRSARDRHHSGWQVIETRTGDMSRAHEQFVYSLAYIDAVVLRDRDSDNSAGTGNNGVAGSGLDERLYFQQDREFNVTALVDAGGVVKERYAYDPYGTRQILKDDWTLQGASPYANNIGFTGRWHDVTGMIYFRARYMEPVLGRFVQRDDFHRRKNIPTPTDGYQDGLNLYGTYFVPRGSDPSGLGGDFVVGARDLEGTDSAAERVINGLAGVYHVNLFYRGKLIRLGFGGSMRNNESLAGYRPTVLKRSYLSGGTNMLMWGKGAGAPCSCAGDFFVLDCIKSKPPAAGNYDWLTNSCQTDIQNTVSECCLTGYRSTVAIYSDGYSNGGFYGP